MSITNLFLDSIDTNEDRLGFFCSRMILKVIIKIDAQGWQSGLVRNVRENRGQLQRQRFFLGHFVVGRRMTRIAVLKPNTLNYFRSTYTPYPIDCSHCAKCLSVSNARVMFLF